MAINIERRVLTASTVSSTDPKTLVGYAARYSSKANIGEFWEVIAPGAFRSAIKRRDDIRLLVDHNPTLLLGRTASGTLDVEEDSKGLRFTGRVPNTQVARDTMELVKRGDISGCSFGFIVGPGNDSWTDEKDEKGNSYILRTILDFANVSDCSVCTFPAYDSTNVAARAVVPEAVLVEARALGAKAGRIVAPRVGNSRYRRMTDYEIACAIEEEKALRGMAVGETPYPWQRK